MKLNLFLIGLLFISTWVNAQEIKKAWLTTDRTVDCSSFDSIKKALVKEGMTDEEIAIAYYHFFRQMVYHYMNMPESREPLKTINVIGNTLCGSQATCMKGLLASVGIKARVVSHPGHTFYEAFYDNKWHGYDTFANFFVFKDGNKNVASFEELAADHSLIDNAESEKRACPNWVPCGDKPSAFKAPIKITDYEPRTSDWDVKNYSLRQGEELVRTWWPHGYPVPGTYKASQGPGPFHTCGSQDRKNPPELFQFWEPYGIPKFGKVSISYRHYFNGWINFSPDLSAEEYAKPLSNKELIIPIQCSYYISGGKLYYKANTAKEGDKVEVFVSVKKGKWIGIGATDKTGLNQYKIDLTSHIANSRVGYHEYQLKFVISGEAKLENFYLRTIFSHNAMAAPHLMPGNNKVTLEVENPEDIKKSPLTIIYRYKKAPNWSDEVVVEKLANQSPFQFEIKTDDTKKLPQMTDITLRNGKIFWEPELSSIPDKVIADFSQGEIVAQWGGDKPLVLKGEADSLLVSSSEAAQYPQISAKMEGDWSLYKTVEIELENVGDKKQEVIFRVRSNEKNEERTDIPHQVSPGKYIMTIPVSTLTKTKLNSISKVYLMFAGIPETGCQIKVKKITLLPDRSF